MKRFLFALFILGSLVTAKAGDLKETLPIYWIKSIKEDRKLAAGQVEITVLNSRLPKILPQQRVVYSVDGIQDTAQLDEQRNFNIQLEEGTHIFQFFYDEMHYEIYTDTISFLGQHRYELELNWQIAHMEIMVDKPVIYLYPSEKMPITLKVIPRGELTFTYPVYTNGWNIFADPSGEIIHNDQFYNYLFWESEQAWMPKIEVFESGFVIEKENVLAFLEEKLTAFGLNSKEKADFITFWGPQLIQNKRNFIHFMFNEEANEFAELEITPKPDQIYRIYMISMPLNDHDEYDVPVQTIEPINRSGFTVIEWGGSKISKKQLHSDYKL